MTLGLGLGVSGLITVSRLCYIRVLASAFRKTPFRIALQSIVGLDTYKGAAPLRGALARTLQRDQQRLSTIWLILLTRIEGSGINGTDSAALFAYVYRCKHIYISPCS